MNRPRLCLLKLDPEKLKQPLKSGRRWNSCTATRFLCCGKRVKRPSFWPLKLDQEKLKRLTFAF
ncbi:hypothetical protein QUF79_02225 [Fictibacillus enclensis]|uniref:hypothetical protein n=1 Tax=Fictibacillus enclensis TaxID=1017270 RepID=UPI0025A0594A|nr:hypothetical protein [Fictibacillus enclensis]MDM5196874.1 hypothetical protein [Fictibacillus enclensis]